MEEEKKNLDSKEYLIEKLSSEVSSLKNDLIKLESDKEELEKNRLMLKDLFDMGYIDENGNPLKGE